MKKQDASIKNTADYVIQNGRIYTSNPGQLWAEAVAVTGDRIVYVGDKAGARKYEGEGTTVIDL
jgi:predicted amidohydrolase YtcJ